MKQNIFRVVALCGGAAFASASVATAESLADKIKRGAENAGEAIGDGLSATGHAIEDGAEAVGGGAQSGTDGDTEQTSFRDGRSVFLLDKNRWRVNASLEGSKYWPSPELNDVQ